MRFSPIFNSSTLSPRIPGGTATITPGREIPIELYPEIIKRIASQIALYYAKAMYWQIATFTPIDTGALKGNWRGTTGAVEYSFDFNYKGVGPNHMPREPSFRETLFPRYHITNAAWYGHEIEFLGKSKKKAPMGMVRRGFHEVMARPVTLAAITQDLR